MNISKLAKVLKAATPRAQVARIGSMIEKLPGGNLKQHAVRRLKDAAAMIDADGHVERWQLFHIVIEDARRTALNAVYEPYVQAGANIKKARKQPRQRFSTRLVVAEIKLALNIVSADQLVHEWREGLQYLGEHEIEAKIVNGVFVAHADNPNSEFYDCKIAVSESTVRDAAVR